MRFSLPIRIVLPPVSLFSSPGGSFAKTGKSGTESAFLGEQVPIFKSTDCLSQAGSELKPALRRERGLLDPCRAVHGSKRTACAHAVVQTRSVTKSWSRASAGPPA
jgi:hypothetical protein